MRAPSMGLAPDGLPVLWLVTAATLTFAALGWAWAALPALVLLVFCLNFFRDPERVVPQGPGLVVAPADGKVVRLGRAPDPFTGEPRQCVCVFMNVFNVHVNRAPVDATVTRIDYHEGRYINASLDKASEHNERCAIGLEDDGGGRWTMVQIAGLVARRIVCRAETGDALARGQRFGMIKFGSRVDLYLPDDYDISVGMGDKTTAGRTVVARRKEST
jgi:phosphatidylserine decarboxylase